MITTIKKLEDGYLVNGNMSVPIAEGNKDYQEVIAWIAEGNTPEEAYTAEELEAIAKNKMNQEALAYLAKTDWYIVREAEGGAICPDDIKALRAEARARIV